MDRQSYPPPNFDVAAHERVREHNRRMESDPEYARNYYQQQAERAARRRELARSLGVTAAMVGATSAVLMAIGWPIKLALEATGVIKEHKEENQWAYGPIPPASMKLSDGRIVDVRPLTPLELSKQADLVLGNPGSDYLRNEFASAGSRAPELAAMYAQFLHLVDSPGEYFTTVADLARFQSWQRVAYSLLPDAYQQDAFCLVQNISKLQGEVGLLPMTDPNHPLYTAGSATQPVYVEQTAQWKQSCGR